MSAAIYHDPYRLRSGLLALGVHSAFFVLLYFGFSWNRQVFSPATMNVELWSSLPEEVVAPPDVPKVEEAPPPKLLPPPPPKPEKMIAPDIAIPDKKKVAVKPEKVKPVPKAVAVVKPDKDIRKLAEKRLAERIEKKQVAREQAEQLRQDEQAARDQAERARQDAQAAQDAAKGKLVDEYKARIQARIKRNIVQPPNVRDNVSAKFLVTLLPGGAVLKAELAQSSGNAAYDNAVERAILKSSPLPLPPDVQLFKEFREILMTFKPEQPTE